MSLIRAMFLLLAVCLPTTWTLAHAADEGAGGSAGETSKSKSKKGSKKKGGGKAGEGGEGEPK
jgi:hypothetical protein